jgi:hypothetical protein
MSDEECEAEAVVDGLAYDKEREDKWAYIYWLDQSEREEQHAREQEELEREEQHQEERRRRNGAQ